MNKNICHFVNIKESTLCNICFNVCKLTENQIICTECKTQRLLTDNQKVIVSYKNNEPVYCPFRHEMQLNVIENRLECRETDRIVDYINNRHWPSQSIKYESYPNDNTTTKLTGTPIDDVHTAIDMITRLDISYTHGNDTHIFPSIGLSPSFTRFTPLHLTFDLDGVVYDFCNALKDYLHIHHGKTLESMDAPPSRWDFYLDWGIEKEDFMDLYKKGITDKWMLKKGNVIENAIECINNFKKKGHFIHLISNRGIKGVEKEAWDNTVDWLTTNGMNYDTLDFDFNKGKYVKIYNIDIFVEDMHSNAIDIIEQGCPLVLLYDQPWNREYDSLNYKRVYSWKAISKEIDKEINKKNR